LSHYLCCKLLISQADATKSLDISYPVTQFKKFIIDAEQFDEKTMSVKVVHTRKYEKPEYPRHCNLAIADFVSTALPDDVFLKGETRPKKPSKKKTDAKSVKRQFADTGLDVRDSRLTRTSRRLSAPWE
jgi:poly(A) polymerase